VCESVTCLLFLTEIVVACQHFLRGERGVYYEDLYPLISFLPRYANGKLEGSEAEKLPLWYDDEDDQDRKIDTPATELGRHESRDQDSSGFDPEKALPHVASERPLKPARNPPETKLHDYIPLIKMFRWIARRVSRRARARPERRQKKKAYQEYVESHVPLEIILVLSK